MKKLSIIIVNYNSEKILPACLEEFFSSERILDDWEIIISNNDSHPIGNSLKNKFSGLEILENGKNAGFSGGANAGARAATGEVLLFLNPDARISRNNLDKMLGEISGGEGDVWGPRILDPQGKTQKWIAGKKITLWGIIRNNLRISSGKKIWNSRKRIEADWVAGTALFIKREIFEKVGGFDENFFMYFEDVDLCLKVQKAGGKIIYYPGVSLFHAGGVCYDNFGKQKKDYYDSLEYYFRKNRNFLEYLIVKIIRKIFFQK